jgi:hypothetical protein
MAQWNDGDFYDASFSVHKSRRYHAKMRAFYRNLYDLTVAATALTGSAAFVSLIGDSSWLAKWLTGIVAIASTLELVFGLSKKADIHDSLCRRFTELAADIERKEATEENLQEVRARRLMIERDEPTERRLIDLLAQNEECRSRGVSPDDLVPITMPQRVLGYVWTFGMSRIDKWWAQRKKKPAPISPTVPT